MYAHYIYPVGHFHLWTVCWILLLHALRGTRIFSFWEELLYAIMHLVRFDVCLGMFGCSLYTPPLSHNADEDNQTIIKYSGCILQTIIVQIQTDRTQYFEPGYEHSLGMISGELRVNSDFHVI